MRAAKLLLEEQEKKRAEEDLYEAAVRRIKFREKVDQFKQQKESSEPPVSSPLHAFTRSVEADQLDDITIFGDFDVDISDPKAFTMQEYGVDHFSDEHLSSSLFSKKRCVGHTKVALPIFASFR